MKIYLAKFLDAKHWKTFEDEVHRWIGVEEEEELAKTLKSGHGFQGAPVPRARPGFDIPLCSS